MIIALSIIVIFLGIVAGMLFLLYKLIKSDGNAKWIVLALFIAPFFLSAGSVVINNLKKSTLEERFKYMDMPFGTYIMEVHSYYGNFRINKGLGYSVIVLVKSDLSLEQLQEEFNDCKVTQLDRNYFYNREVCTSRIFFRHLEDETDFENYYAIAVGFPLEESFILALDPRGIF